MEYKYNLKKALYEAKSARDILDEEFSEFLPKKRSISEFFNLYNTNFYKIIRDTHLYLIKKSQEYVTDWIHPKLAIIKNLMDELNLLQIEIHSVEKTHPIVPNGVVITPNPENEWNNINNIELYYLQSGVLREIKNSENISKEELFYKLKHHLRKGRVKNEDVLYEGDSSLVSSITHGRPIETEENVSDTTYCINTGNCD